MIARETVPTRGKYVLRYFPAKQEWSKISVAAAMCVLRRLENRAKESRLKKKKKDATGDCNVCRVMIRGIAKT